jgi:hypothetical protein
MSNDNLFTIETPDNEAEVAQELRRRVTTMMNDPTEAQHPGVIFQQMDRATQSISTYHASPEMTVQGGLPVSIPQSPALPSDDTSGISAMSVIAEFLRSIGLPWMTGNHNVRERTAILRFSGGLSFDLPIGYHACVNSDRAVLLAQDSRTLHTPTINSITPAFTTELIISDERGIVDEPEVIPVVTPVPSPLIIDLGAIRLILLVKR